MLVFMHVLQEKIFLESLLRTKKITCYERSHVNDFRKVNSGCNLLMKTTWMFKPLEMKWSNDWKFLQSELFGGLLVSFTMGTSDLGHAAQMFCLSESLETILQADGVSDGRKIQGDVPEWINGCRDTLTHLQHYWLPLINDSTIFSRESDSRDSVVRPSVCSSVRL